MEGRVFLIIQQPDLGEAIKRFLTGCTHWRDELIEKANVPERITFGDVQGLYSSIATLIEEKAGPHELRQSIAIADLQVLECASLNIHSNPLSTSQQKKYPNLTLAGMLVLTFPELRWLFFGRHSTFNAASQDPIARHACSSNDLNDVISSSSASEPLFDPSGLRNHIRLGIKQSAETGPLAQSLVLREKHCAAIDDEGSYAFLHAYLGYRLGFDVQVVTSEALLAGIFGRRSNSGSTTDIQMTFEDVFLNFPDRTSDELHLSRLEERDLSYEGLKEVKLRIFVTAGHRNVGWDLENRNYVKALKSLPERQARTVYKPSGGIYNILEKAKLLNDYWQLRREEWLAANPSRRTSQTGGGHSAPGRFLTIAVRLIRRADRILRQAETVEDCVHGATLALEAQELLGYRTPTTSLEAIALRHQLETMAECMFYGVGYSKDVKNRLREIEREVSTVAEWFHPSVRKASTLNAQMSITTEVMRVFRESGQFDEEQQCLIHLRKLHRRTILLNRPWLGVVYPALWYVETLVGSFPLFVMALFLWPALFGLATWAVGAQYGHPGSVQTLGDFMTHSFITFFGIGPLEFPRSFAQPFTVLLMMLGFTHLGIFIAHLYTVLSRR